MAQRDTGSQSGWHVGTLRDRSGAGRHLEPPGSASGSPIRRDDVRTTSTPPPRPTSQELAAVTANPKPKSALYSSMSSDSPGGGSPGVPRSTSPSQGLAKIPSSPAPSSAALSLPPPNYPLPSVPGSGSVSPNRPRLLAAPGSPPDPASLAPPAAAAPASSQSLSPRRMSPANTSSMRVLDKDEIARRKRELENFDSSFLSVSRGIVVDCKEMNTLVQQVAQLVTSKAPHTSPKQRFVDLAMRTPKSCMTVCELIEQRISESLFASLKREQEVLQLCGRTVRNRVFALVRVAAQAMKDAELGRDVDFIPLATLTSDTAKSVKALLAAGSTLKLKESSMTQALQTKMRAFHTAQKLRLNEAAKENALVMRSMLQANTAGDKEQFLLLGRSLIVGFTKLMKEFKGPKVKTEERRLQLALSTLISDAKAAAKERTRQTQEQVEKSKTQLITAMKDYINAVLNAIDSSAIVYDGESLRALDKQQIEAAIKIQRRWRAYLQKKGRSATVRPASAETPGVARKTPKEYAIEEVITSEESYLASLRTLLREFVQPLRKSSSTSAQPFITSKDIAVIFANVEQIVANTERFLDELKRARAEVGTVGNAFLRCMDLMGPYTEYTANFDRSQERIEALRANGLFKNFVKECTKRVPGTLEMGSYLIMPVQRTPRYLILLEAVEKHTPPPDPDARVIHEAVERMKVLNDEINNYKNEQDNRYAFASISRRTQDFPMDLYKPDRFFLREVDFEFLRPKKSFFSTLSSPLSLPSAAPLPFTDKRQLNHFFIFNDLLVRAKPGRSPDTYVFEEAIPLSGFSVEILTEVRDGEWALRMTRKVSGREEELQFFVPDETTRTLWVTQLTQLLQALEVGELCI